MLSKEQLGVTAAMLLTWSIASGCVSDEESEPTSTMPFYPTSTETDTYEEETPTPLIILPTEIPTIVITETSIPDVERVYFDEDRVKNSYIFPADHSKTLEEQAVDPEILAAVLRLEINPQGDITDLLIKAIPADDAKKQFPDSLGVRLAIEYRPVGVIVNTYEVGIPMVKGYESQTLNVDAAVSLAALLVEAKNRGIDVYMAHGFRDNEMQRALDAANPLGAAGRGGSEHLIGLTADLYGNEYAGVGLSNDFIELANEYGWVRSLGPGDPPHYFYLDGVWPGLTRALIEAGYNPNDRYVSVQARLAVFQILIVQETR